MRIYTSIFDNKEIALILLHASCVIEMFVLKDDENIAAGI